MSGSQPSSYSANSIQEWQDRVKAMRKTGVYKAADDIKKDLAEAVRAFAQRIGAVGAVADELKGEDRASEKVAKDYGGDWYKIKDLARGTIIVNNKIEAEQAFRAARAYFVTSNGWRVHTEKPPPANPQGYSDWKIFVERHNMPAEIQINTKPMMYGKDLKFFRKVCAADEGWIRARYPIVPPGLGHAFYEITRDLPPNSAREQEVSAVAAIYYAFFRAEPPKLSMTRDVISAIARANIPISVGH